jgi:hypothetical protein
MTVQLADDGTILLLDDCPAEDADMLLQLILSTPDAAMDWRACRSAHTAVIQVLLASGCIPIGPPQGGFLSTMIAPALARTGVGETTYPPPISTFSEAGRDAK